MIEIGTKIRAAYVTALEGIIYSGNTVPIVDDKLETTSNVYMRLTTQNYTSTNTKSYFAGECDVVIQIISVQKTAVSKAIVEDICNDVLTTLFPTRNTNGLTLDPSLKLSYALLVNTTNATAVQLADGLEISKTITVRNRVTQ